MHELVIFAGTLSIMEQDIRWQQRFSNYKKALGQLQKFIDKGALNELEQQGLVQSFEYTYELAWNVMKDDLLTYRPNKTYPGAGTPSGWLLTGGLSVMAKYGWTW